MVDRVLDPRYVEGLSDLSTEDVTKRLEDAVEVERETSAARRALHRIIDDIQRELEGRSADAG